MTASAVLAEWGLALQLADVPDQARRAALRHLLDGLGCAVAATSATSATPTGSATSGGSAGLGGGGQGFGEGGRLPAVVVALGLGGPPEATIVGARQLVGAPAAALANGVLVHTLDFDDTHAGGLVHATAPVLPVALAVGEEVGATGAEVLVAAIAGYETICRLGAAVPHGFHARGLHATSACGVFAAALVAARLYGMPHDQTVNALGIAGSQAGGLLEFLSTGASTKQLHPGFAAHAGILAARLARAGATGPDSVLEGRHGLYGALLGKPGLDPTADLGERWEVTRITIKPYPACQLLHAALDAAARLTSGGEIVEIVAEVHPDAAAIVCGPGKDRPRSAYDAKFSLPWSVAAMIIDGEVTVRTYDEISRKDVADLAAKVRHEVVDFPGVAADQPGRLLVRYADGSRVVAEVPRSSGGPDDPDIEGLVLRKALANGLTPDLVEQVLQLATLPNVRPLMEALSDLGSAVEVVMAGEETTR